MQRRRNPPNTPRNPKAMERRRTEMTREKQGNPIRRWVNNCCLGWIPIYLLPLPVEHPLSLSYGLNLSNVDFLILASECASVGHGAPREASQGEGKGYAPLFWWRASSQEVSVDTYGQMIRSRIARLSTVIERMVYLHRVGHGSLHFRSEDRNLNNK